MIVVIVLLDQFVWRPVIAWAEKFKVEQVESAATLPLVGARPVPPFAQACAIREKTVHPLSERLMLYFRARRRDR